MSIRSGFALFPLLLLGIPAFAEPTCFECLSATQEELRRCLNNAISEEDKLQCDLNQRDQARACEDGECKVEREAREKKPDAPLQKE